MSEEDKRELDNLIYTLHIHHIDTSLLFEMRDTIQKQQEKIKELNKILLEVCYERAKQYFEEEPEV